MFGRKAFFPNFDLKYPTGFIYDREVSLQLSMCPELYIINDYLWDVNESDLHATDLLINLRMHLSNTAALQTIAEQRQRQDQIIKNEQTKGAIKNIKEAAAGAGKKVSQQEIDKEALA